MDEKEPFENLSARNTTAVLPRNILYDNTDTNSFLTRGLPLLSFRSFPIVVRRDNFDIVLDGEEQLNTPVLGTILSRMIANNGLRSDPRKWRGEDTQQASLLPPLIRLKALSRVYCKFGRPIDGSKLDYNDREACQAVYLETRETVRQLIGELLTKRKEDPYADFRKRFLFESAQQVQAPTAWNWSTSQTFFAEEDIIVSD